MKVGRKLAVKLLNASKFALADLPPAGDELASPLDRAHDRAPGAVVEQATASFEDYDYARALERTETFFWWYCDYYLELVKGRRYDPDPAVSGPVSLALRLSLSTFQRLFAPFLPFVCRGGVVVVAGRLDPPRAWPTSEQLLADARAAGGRTRGGAPARSWPSSSPRRCCGRCARPSPQAQRPMRAPVARWSTVDRPRVAAAGARARSRGPDRGGRDRAAEAEAGEELSVGVSSPTRTPEPAALG